MDREYFFQEKMSEYCVILKPPPEKLEPKFQKTTIKIFINIPYKCEKV